MCSNDVKRPNENIFFGKMQEECGIFGGYCKENKIAPIIKQGLFKLQHRGQESAGIVSGNESYSIHKAQGLVNEVFTEIEIKNLSGNFGIGHVRYSTQGGVNPNCTQPFMFEVEGEQVAMAHNGHVKSSITECFQSDSEFILKKVISDIGKKPSSWSFEDVGKSLDNNFSQGAFCLVFTLPERILAFRDSFGYRPLMFCDAEEGYFVASEDVAFNELSVNKIVEIQAGYGLEITSNGYEIKKSAKNINEQRCIFEHLYFASPESNIFGSKVYESRISVGKLLARNESKFINADIVVPVLKSGFAAAIGYAKESGIPFKMGLVLKNSKERSFIQPNQEDRIKTIREKLEPVQSLVNGKKIILIDDSLVRGTTSTEIVKMLREAGAKEIHFRSASPMIINTCSWGVDIPTKEELIAYNYIREKEIAKQIGADSLKFLTLEDLKSYFGKNGWCYNCFMAKNQTNIDEIGVGKCQKHTEIPALI